MPTLVMKKLIVCAGGFTGDEVANADTVATIARRKGIMAFLPGARVGGFP